MLGTQCHGIGAVNSQLARSSAIVDSLGSDSFGKCFFAFLNGLIDIDDFTVFVMPTGSRPLCLVAEGRSDRAIAARHAAQKYVNHYFSVDPNLSRLHEAIRGKSQVLRYVHRDSIPNVLYRSKFFDEYDIEEKVSLLTRLEGGYLYTNFYRAPNHKHFDEEQIEEVKEISRFAISCLRKHMRYCAQSLSVDGRQNRLHAVYQLLTMREGSHLTAREADVCARIILGLSTTAIALELGVTKNTVSTIRKRAYERLGICSQNELFALCLKGLIGGES
jgi:DNA-binding CsgD family transcriptional regulator